MQHYKCNHCSGEGFVYIYKYNHPTSLTRALALQNIGVKTICPICEGKKLIEVEEPKYIINPIIISSEEKS